MELLIKALLDGDHAAALAEARGLVAAGTQPQRIILEAVQPAMERLDEKCTVEQFNLLEIMLTGRAVATVVKELFPEGPPAEGSRGTLVIGSLQGDIHDLGKNVTKAVLLGKGFRVVDCGKDCPVETLVGAALREQARAILVSGLLTVVIPQVRKIRPLLDQEGGAQIRVVAGGAALKQASPAELNCDFVAENAFIGARYIEQLVEGRP